MISNRMLRKSVRKENLAVAYSIIGGIPAYNISLNEICNRTISRPEDIHSDVIACAIGWLGLHPHFRQRGLELSGGRIIDTTVNYTREYTNITAIATKFFGKDAFDQMFTIYGYGEHDEHLIAEFRRKHGKTCSHKDLALARMMHVYHNSY